MKNPILNALVLAAIAITSLDSKADHSDPKKAIAAQLDVTRKAIRQTIERVADVSRVRLPVNLKDYERATTDAIRNLDLSLEHFETMLTKQVMDEELANLMAQYNTSYHLIENPSSRDAFLKNFKDNKLIPALEAREALLQKLTHESLRKIGIPFFRTVFTKRSKRIGGRLRELDNSQSEKYFSTVIDENGIVLGSYRFRDPNSFMLGIEGPFNSDPIDQIVRYKQSLIKTDVFKNLASHERSLKENILHAINLAPKGAEINLPDFNETWYDSRYMNVWFEFSPARKTQALTQSEYTNQSFMKGTFAFKLREIEQVFDAREGHGFRYHESDRRPLINQEIDRVVDAHITEIFPNEPAEWRDGVAALLVTNLKKSCRSQICVTLLAEHYHYLLRTLTLGLFAKSYEFTLEDGSKVSIQPREHQWFSVYRALQFGKNFPISDLPYDL